MVSRVAREWRVLAAGLFLVAVFAGTATGPDAAYRRQVAAAATVALVVLLVVVGLVKLWTRKSRHP